jgi:hypothetical protein
VQQNPRHSLFSSSAEADRIGHGLEEETMDYFAGLDISTIRDVVMLPTNFDL